MSAISMVGLSSNFPLGVMRRQWPSWVISAKIASCNFATLAVTSISMPTTWEPPILKHATLHRLHDCCEHQTVRIRIPPLFCRRPRHRQQEEGRSLDLAAAGAPLCGAVRAPEASCVTPWRERDRDLSGRGWPTMYRCRWRRTPQSLTDLGGAGSAVPLPRCSTRALLPRHGAEAWKRRPRASVPARHCRSLT